MILRCKEQLNNHNLLVNFTQILHLVERSERYGCNSGEGPYSILTEEWPELSPTPLCSGLAAAEAQCTPAVGRGFLPGRAAHTTEQSPHKVLPAKPAAQAKGDINPASVQNIAQVGIMPRAHGREPATTLHVEN